MKKTLLLAAAVIALAAPSFAQQAPANATVSTQGQEGLGLGGLTPAAAAGVVAGVVVLGVVIGGLGDDDDGSSSGSTTTTTTTQ